MDKPMQRYRFKIDAFTPDTLPMARLAEYLEQLAQLLGEKEYVHFEKLSRGSTEISTKIDNFAVPKVNKRLIEAEAPDAPQEVARPYRHINKMLALDNAKGVLRDERREIVRFAGRDAPSRTGPIVQEGDIVGSLVRIGGTSTPVHAQLMADGTIYNCDLRTELARQMAPYLFGPPLRVIGNGKWFRDPEKGWELERFQVLHFEVLPDENLVETVQKLRAVDGGEWSSLDDPFADLMQMRYGEGSGT